MKLSVSEIRILSSGAIAVEVGGGNSGVDRPAGISIDAVRFQVYVPKEQVTNDLTALKAAAIEAVRKQFSAE